MGESDNQQETEDEDTTTSTAAVATATVNIQNQKAFYVLGILYQRFKRNEGERKRLLDLSEGQSIEKRLKEARTLTAGVCVANNIFNASDPGFIREYKRRQEVKRKLLEEKEKRTRDRFLKLRNDIVRIRAKNKEIDSWSAADCKSMIQYKKVKGDSAMPKNIEGLRARCKEVCGRASPLLLPQPNVEDLMSLDDDADADADVLSFDAEEGAVWM